MNWNEYLSQFDRIIAGEINSGIYEDPTYIEYTKLNKSRMNRWMKRGVLIEELKDALNRNDATQKWVIITEPWCGDAAHSVPFLKLMSEYSSNIKIEFQLRDSEGSEIENYLTNGNRSIPKLIVRDENNNDLFTWGARPKDAEAFVENQKTSSLSKLEKKAELQVWYNKNKGISMQKEIASLLS